MSTCKQINKLIIKMVKAPLTDVRKERRAYRKLENKTENLIRRLHKPCSIEPPVITMLKNKKISLSRKYIICDNKKKTFNVSKKFNFGNILEKSKYNLIIIPVHINNRVTGKEHLNILVCNKSKKTIQRIDPSNQKGTMIMDDKYKKGINKFFKKWSFKYTGFSPKSKIILHGGLCRFATPALFLYGKKLTHCILKRCIIKFLIDSKKNICKKKKFKLKNLN